MLIIYSLILFCALSFCKVEANDNLGYFENYKKNSFESFETNIIDNIIRKKNQSYKIRFRVICGDRDSFTQIFYINSNLIHWKIMEPSGRVNLGGIVQTNKEGIAEINFSTADSVVEKTVILEINREIKEFVTSKGPYQIYLSAENCKKGIK